MTRDELRKLVSWKPPVSIDYRRTIYETGYPKGGRSLSFLIRTTYDERRPFLGDNTMWRTYWQDIDESTQTEILSVILRETRHYHRMLWRRRGSKFAEAFCGLRWTVTMKLEEFSEIPSVVARRGEQAILLCCDRQESRVPSSVLLNDLLTAVLQQLPLIQAGVSSSGENERIEDGIAKQLERSREMSDAEALAGAFLQHFRGR